MKWEFYGTVTNLSDSVNFIKNLWEWHMNIREKYGPEDRNYRKIVEF